MEAESIVRFIAQDYVELSHDKVKAQRDSYVQLCRKWVQENTEVTESKRQLDDNF